MYSEGNIKFIFNSFAVLLLQTQLVEETELFQILTDDAVKVLHSICQQIWKTQQWPWDWRRSVFIPILKKGNTKECSNYCTIALISHVSKVMLKILQARLQQYMNSSQNIGNKSKNNQMGPNET